MGKKIKKGTKGTATQFMSRAKAIRKLQLSLKDFRRLCILKGVYPREPKKNLKGTLKTTFYHVKDINFLAHDQLIQKFRDIKAHLKKYKKALSKGNQDKASKLKENKPKYTLHHLIRERYPTFLDSIRDLDDPLCLINLFASFQAHHDHNIPADRTQKCYKLAREFNLYVIKSKSLRKVFLSIKGQQVTWITPYQFVQNMPYDVDYRIMLTFLEFYEILLKFVNYKLFSSINLVYPPKVDPVLEHSEYNTYSAFILEEKQNIQEETQAKEQKYAISTEFAKENEKLFKASGCNVNMFQNLVFYLSRETPRISLEFVILSFSGKVIYDVQDQDFSNDNSITHVVTDRDPKHIKFLQNREYVQPQWIYDCINNNFLAPVKEYAPGKILPPHLSPFVDNVKEGYIPERQKELNKLKGEEEEIVVDEELENQLTNYAVANGEQGEDDDEIEEEEENDVEEGQDKFDVEEEIKKKQENKMKELLENKRLARTMLTKKRRRILGKILFAKEKKRKEIEKLKHKAALKTNKKK